MGGGCGGRQAGQVASWDGEQLAYTRLAGAGWPGLPRRDRESQRTDGGGGLQDAGRGPGQGATAAAGVRSKLCTGHLTLVQFGGAP